MSNHCLDSQNSMINSMCTAGFSNMQLIICLMGLFSLFPLLHTAAKWTWETEFYLEKALAEWRQRQEWRNCNFWKLSEPQGGNCMRNDGNGRQQEMLGFVLLDLQTWKCWMEHFLEGGVQGLIKKKIANKWLNQSTEVVRDIKTHPDQHGHSSTH